VAAFKRDAVAALVRDMIADGTLVPGGAAPSGAELARKTGYQVVTCRAGLRILVADGTLTRGVSATARLRVAQAGESCHGDAEMLQGELSRTLAARRRAAGLTQPELADVLGVSVTTVGHAETGRTWQSRDFWRQADHLLGADGDLLRLYDTYQSVRHAAPEAANPAAPEEAAAPLPLLPVSVTITPDGVAVVWSDGTETLARPPGGGPREKLTAYQEA
jgi:transcriptional regulator with XRE-family HTH domain